MVVEFDNEHEEKIRKWVTERGGVIKWTNLELTMSGSPYVYTPVKTETGEDMGPPHWKYGERTVIDPTDIVFNDFIVHETFIGRMRKNLYHDITVETRRKAEKLVPKYPGSEIHWYRTVDQECVVEIVTITKRKFTDPPNVADTKRNTGDQQHGATKAS